MIADSKEIKDTFINSEKSENQSIDLTVVDGVNELKNEDSTSIVVDKEYYDDMSKANKRILNDVLEEEIENKKQIIFYGDNTNLDIDGLVENFNYNFSLKSESSIDPATLIGCSFLYDENNVLMLTKYYNIEGEKGIDESMRLFSLQNECTLDEVNDSGITTQLNVYNNSQYESYTDIMSYKDLDCAITYGRKRVAVGSQATKWEIYQNSWLFAKNSNQSKYIKLWVRPYDWNGSTRTKRRDEQLVDFLPQPSQATNSSGGSTSFGNSVSLNVGTSVTVGNTTSTTTTSSYQKSYKDIEIKTGQDNYEPSSIRWDFLFKAGSSAAKCKNSVSGGALLINRKGDMGAFIKSEFRTRYYSSYWDKYIDNDFVWWTNKMLWYDIKNK